MLQSRKIESKRHFTYSFLEPASKISMNSSNSCDVSRVLFTQYTNPRYSSSVGGTRTGSFIPPFSVSELGLDNSAITLKKKFEGKLAGSFLDFVMRWVTGLLGY